VSGAGGRRHNPRGADATTPPAQTDPATANPLVGLAGLVDSSVVFEQVAVGADGLRTEDRVLVRQAALEISPDARHHAVAGGGEP
jgi:hypothetical protein